MPRGERFYLLILFYALEIKVGFGSEAVRMPRNFPSGRGAVTPKKNSAQGLQIPWEVPAA